VIDFVKKLLVLASVVAMAVLSVAGTARAAQGPAALVPVVDAFEDGGQRLRLIALPAPEGAPVEVTLVYEDTERQALRSMTVDPEVVTSTKDAAFTAFLDQMDPDFLVFVRASLADRLLHLKGTQTNFDRAESTLFFPHAVRDGRVAHSAAAEEAREAE
jgi:hypothetical protein